MAEETRNRRKTDHGIGRVYKQAVDQTAIVAATDLHGTIIYVNETFCEISKYSQDELVGQNHRILNSGHHPRSFFTEMYRMIHAGKKWKADVCNRAKDGSIYWVDTTIIPTTDDSGNIDGFFTIRHDITARKLREDGNARDAESMRAASLAKSEFLANMSHEIRTPMNAILGYTEILSGEEISEKGRGEHLDTIRRNGEHLLSVINDVLDISKIEAGRMEVDPIDTMTIEMIAEVVTLMKVRSDAKGLTLELEFETEIPRLIRTDPLRMRQILINLIGNAIKFTEVGGVRLIVGLENDPVSPMLRIEVADTGIGMTPDQINNIFEPFEQADSSTTRRFGGTGLGLHISRRLAAMLDGEILVSSTPDVGASFITRIPICIKDGIEIISSQTAWDEMVEHRNRAAKQAAAADDTVLEGKRILLVEDGPDNRRLVIHFLNKAGAEVVAAENGRIALNLIERGEEFDVVLMDVQMPEMDGQEATMRIRRLGYDRPIIALTAHAMTEERESCIKAGCDEFLTKPIVRSKLIETIANWCRDDTNRRAA